MHIFIPTLGRASQCHRGTISKIPEEWLGRTTLVVQEHEADDYDQQAMAFGCGLLVLPKTIDRIEPTRRHIARHCRERRIQRMLMLDDDIEFYIRRQQESLDDNWWRLSAPSADETDRILQEIDRALDDHAHVGLSGREGNNRVRAPHVLNTRYMRALAYRVEDYMQTEGGRVEIMEDFDVALQMLKAGKDCLVFYQYAQGQGKTQAAGGCSTWRTLELHNRGVQKMAELHPGLVRVREKKNKTDSAGFGTRQEATIYWKRARASHESE